MSAVLALVLVALAACGTKSSAPVTFTVTKVEPGAIDVDEVNPTDLEIAHYWLVYRFTDAHGMPVKVRRHYVSSDGTSSDQDLDFDFTTVSGGMVICAPRSTCHLHLGHINVPAGAAHGEVRAVRLTAIRRSADGSVTNIEPPLLDRRVDVWPI